MQGPSVAQEDGIWEMVFQRERKAWPMKVSVQLGHSHECACLGEMVENSFEKVDLSQGLGRNCNLQ